MKIQDLRPSVGSVKSPKRVGRGPGSGHGKTSCRGHKGQNSRSGGGVRPGFEGGQMPLQRRLPKRGFHNKFGKSYVVFNISDLVRFDLDEISPEILVEKGIISKVKIGSLKILGSGELTKAVKVKANAFSESASKKIIAAGGSAEVV